MDRFRRVIAAYVRYQCAKRKFRESAKQFALSRMGSEHWAKTRREGWARAFDNDYRSMVSARRALRLAALPELRVKNRVSA